MTANTAFAWPRNDYSRVPNSIYHNPELYEAEQKHIFQGRAWLYLGLEAEIPKPGDFRTTFLGEVPVIYNRDQNGDVHAFVNRCAHRGAMVRREVCGNADQHICVYHQWCYDLAGSLIGVPFQRGIGGQGGTSKEFQRGDHGLRKLRVGTHHGLLFATFSTEAEPLTDYLGDAIASHLKQLMKGRVKVLGYQRQTIRGNWKLYAENTRDQYHGSLLHKFLGTFLTKTTTHAKLLMDPRHRHSIVFSSLSKSFTEPLASTADVVHNIDKFMDTRVLKYIPEFGEEYGTSVCAFFPNAVFQQIRNSLATRQIRPKGPDAFELLWTLFGFEDDTDDLRQQRLLQVNMGGPAGFIASEDGEAIEIVHKATKTQQGSVSVVEMGGTGPIPEMTTARHNDLAVRGFWSYYSELMDLEPLEAVR